MQLLMLYIKKHKKFNNIWIDFSLPKQEDVLINYFYPDINIIAFIGVNGSGKTTIMSFICHVFRYIERHQYKIASDFILSYIINNDKVTISFENKNFFISINDSSKKLLLEYNAKTKAYIRSKDQIGLPYEDTDAKKIGRFLPASVIVSSVDIDYPVDYAWNLKRFVDIYSIRASNYFQKKNSIGLEVSRGILRFITSSLEKDFLILHNLKIYFSSYIKIYFNTDSRNHLFLSDYGKEALDRIRDLLIINNQSNYIEIVESIINLSYFDHYILDAVEIYCESDTLGELFNIEKFLVDKSYNKEIIDILCVYNLVYINDIFLNKSNYLYGIEGMSTGEKNLLGLIFFVLSKIEQNSLIIIEEPEIHLNDNWTGQLMSVFSFYFCGYSSQLLLSSHRFNFMNSLFKEQVFLCDEKIGRPNFNTFLCSQENMLSNLIKSSYENDLINKMQNLLETDNNDTLKELFNRMGESYERYMLFLYLKKSGVINVESE